LVRANGNQTAVILYRSSFDQTGVFERQDVVGTFHEELGHLGTAHLVQFSQESVHNFTGLPALHKDALLRVFNQFGCSLLHNLSSLVRASLLLNSKRPGGNTQLSGSLDSISNWLLSLSAARACFLRLFLFRFGRPWRSLGHT